MSEGKKHDSGKLLMHLIPVSAIEALARVLTFGANKYGQRNWERGIEWSRCFAATLRHLFAWWRGEDTDPETGYSHLDHALAEVAFLREFEVTHRELDDRPKPAGPSSTNISVGSGLPPAQGRIPFPGS